jgi:hypothetical protein
MSVLVFKHSELNKTRIRAIVFDRRSNGVDYLIGNMHIQKDYWEEFQERMTRSGEALFEEDLYVP